MSHWPTTRLRYIADLNPAVRQELLKTPETEVSFLPMEAIGEDGSLSLERTRPVSEVRNGYSYFEDGDVAFAKVTPCFENGKGALMSGLIGAAGFGTTELTVLRPKQGTAPQFLHYVVQSSLFRLLGAAAMTGAGGLKRVPDEFTRDFTTPWPSLVEQTRIANFLDEQTARIDALIAEKERLVEVLHELMVSRLAFEMGGGANASIKTHYEWYPAIPLAWKVIPFKYAVRFVEGPGILAQDFRDEGVPLLRVSSLRGALATLDGCNYLDPVKVAKVWSHFRVKRGDLLISASATMGTVSLVTEDAEGAVPYTGIIILRPDESIAIRDFVRSFVISDQFMRQIDSMKAGATIQHFGPTHLNRVVMAVPESVAEQVVVAARLERWREAYEKSVASITAHVLSLREYRSSMISAAVTGQLDIDSFEKGVA